MARLYMSGMEVDPTTNAGVDWETSSGPNPAKEVTIVHGGSASLKLNTGAGGSNGANSFSIAGVLGVRYFLRVFLYVSGGAPAVDSDIVSLLIGATAVGVSLRYLTTGNLSLVYGDTSATPTTVGSSVAFSSGTWHRVELSGLVNTGTVDTVEAYLDGTLISSATGLAISDSVFGKAKIGWITASPGTNRIMYIDDVALNDDQGAAQNTYPGDGKIVILLPTADSAVGTGWTLGTGTAISANSGSTAVKNTPPVGVADLTAGSDTEQIRNASSNANVNYDATMTTYTAAGVGASDTINVIISAIATAAPVVTSAKAGTVGVVSNPAIANVSLGSGGTAGAFWSGVAGSFYPTGWKISRGTTTYAPSVTFGTAPVMRVTQVTASTRIADVCFMGIYVDYTPAGAAADNLAPYIGGGYYP